MIVAVALSAAAGVVALMLSTAALTDGGTYAAFVAALPLFFLALGQAALVARGTVRGAAHSPGLATLVALAPFAALDDSAFSASESAIVFVVSVLVFLFLAALSFLGGVLLHVLPPIARPAAWTATGLALIAASVVPSIPVSWRLWVKYPPASYVTSLPVAGELRAGGPATIVGGAAFRLRKSERDGGSCFFAAEADGFEGTPVLVDCEAKKLRCDEARKWCFIAGDRWPGYAYGFSYTGEPVSLYDRSERDDGSGDVALRVFAELLALAGAIVLWRGREREDRAVPAASAIVCATTAIGLVIRIMR